MLLGNGFLPMFAVASGGGLTGATWALDGSGRAYNVPTLGSELLTNGTMETGSPPTNWTASSSTLAAAADPRTGSAGSASLVVTNASANASAWQRIVTATGDWVQLSGWQRNVTATSSLMRMLNNSLADLIPSQGTSGTTWISTVMSARATNAFIDIYLRTLGAIGLESRYDDLSAKKITLPTTLATVAGTSATQIAAAKIHTITTGTQAGVGALLDSASNPQNGLFAYHDGTGVTLDKVVNGTWTNLVPRVTVAFSSLAQSEIRPLGSNQFDLYYNGVKRGTTVTVSDTSIINNTIYGLFSTYSGNLFTEFTLDGAVIPFGF